MSRKHAGIAFALYIITIVILLSAGSAAYNHGYKAGEDDGYVAVRRIHGKREAEKNGEGMRRPGRCL